LRWELKAFGSWFLGVGVYFIGGFDILFEGLLVMMIIDYCMGLSLAGIFKRSKKSDNGGLNSWIGWMGIAKKITNLLFVVVAVELQRMTGFIGIREGVILALAANELISIIENAGLMGLPVPDQISGMIDILKKRGENVEKGL
jgi:toxin secretion/phage lysis holin